MAGVIRLVGLIGVVSVLLSCETGHQAPSSSLRPPQASPNPSPVAVRPTVPPTSLKIAGALTAATNAGAGENSCFFGQSLAGEVDVRAPQMALSDGQWGGLEMFVSPLRGSISAGSSAGDGRAIVRLFRHTRPAGGGITGEWFAISGTIAVTEFTNVGDPSRYGVISGSVDARLAVAGGKQQITLRGKWGCVIDPLANGG